MGFAWAVEVEQAAAVLQGREGGRYSVAQARRRSLCAKAKEGWLVGQTVLAVEVQSSHSAWTGCSEKTNGTSVGIEKSAWSQSGSTPLSRLASLPLYA